MFLADSNHGYKMIGVGKLVAEELLSNQRADLRPTSTLAATPRGSAPHLQQPISLELACNQTVSDALLGHESDTAVRRHLARAGKPLPPNTCHPTPLDLFQP